jgi:hypothetical protein
MNQLTESEFLDDVGLKKPDRSLSVQIEAVTAPHRCSCDIAVRALALGAPRSSKQSS